MAHYLTVHLDREAHRRAGADEFQVISVYDADADRTNLVDQEKLYSSLSELRKDIAKMLGVPVEEVHLEEEGGA